MNDMSGKAASTVKASATASSPPPDTFAVTISAPSAVANKGVYAGIFGQPVTSVSPVTLGPPVYLSSSATPVTTSTTLTTVTLASGPGADITVGSTTGFPSSGTILIIQGNTSMAVAYTGTTSNTFTGTTFPAGAGGVGQDQLVVLPNVLGSTLNVGSTSGFAPSGQLMISPPTGYLPNGNAAVTYTGLTSTSFTGVTVQGSLQSIPSGGTIVQMSTPSSSAMNWMLAPGPTPGPPPTSQNLPLINLFPNGPYGAGGKAVATLYLPTPTSPTDNSILSGVMVISVGSAIGLPVAGTTASPSVGSPTPATNPDDIFGLFEWGLTNTNVDFDVSEVDQVGFPFQVTTTGQSPPMPADPTLGVGMRRHRRYLFDGFTSYIQGLHARSAAKPFLACAANNEAAPFAVDTRITAPQDIIGILEGNPPIAAAIAGTPNSGPAIIAYYAVTAVSASGESIASNIAGGSMGTVSSVIVSWQPYPYAASYNIYWSQSSDLSGAQLIGNVTGLTYTDNSPIAHSGAAQTPPANNYTYDPLNSYLTSTIKDFFDFYRTNPFVLDDQATSTTWTGNTTDQTFAGNTYTVLQLTGVAGQWGSSYAGYTLNICQPLFSDNTNDPSLPPAPSWLTGTYSGSESATSMAFGADGAFGSVVAPVASNQTALPVGEAKNLYNDIVSAFNRGITPRKVDGAWVVLPPSYWASSPMLVSAEAGAFGGVLGTGHYRYAITSVVVDNVPLSGAVSNTTQSDPIEIICTAPHNLVTGDRVTITGVAGNTNANGTFMATVVSSLAFTIGAASNGAPVPNTGTWTQATETTRSNIIQVYVDQSSNAVYLTWNSINAPGGSIGAGTAYGFNIYRSELKSGQWSPFMLLTATPFINSPATSWTDMGDPPATSSPPPFGYYRNGTRSNFYAGYFSRNPVSINALSYGYPYADKNGQSTNVQMTLPGPTGLQITLLPWKGPAKLALSGPQPVAVSGAPFPITVSAIADSGAIDTDYRGTICFGLADPAAQHVAIDGMPIATFAHTFTEADKGTKTFTVTIMAANVQHLTVSDIDEESLTATLAVNVPPKRS